MIYISPVVIIDKTVKAFAVYILFIFICVRNTHVTGQVTLNTCCQHQFQYRDGACRSNEEMQRKMPENAETTEIKFESFLKLTNMNLPSYINSTFEFNFKLIQRLPQCSNGSFTITIPFNLSSNHQKYIENATDIYVENVTNMDDENATETNEENTTDANTEIVTNVNSEDVRVYLFPNGYLSLGADNYSPNEYCINSVNNEELSVVVCTANCGPETPCVTKCCDIGKVWDISEFPDGPIQCKYSGTNMWNPVLYSDLYTQEDLQVMPHIIIDHPRNWCANEVVIVSRKNFANNKQKPFRILTDGKTWQKFDRRKWVPFTDGSYCVDGAQNFPGQFEPGQPGFYTGLETDTIVFDCGPEIKSFQSTSSSQLYGIAMIISSCFLLVTVIVYISLWEKQNIHGWTLLGYFVSLFLMYVFLSGVHFASMKTEQNVEGGNTFCYVIGIGAHFFFLSSFCWMSVVNFDLWWTFRALKPTGNRSKGIKRFLAYLTFCLGVPITIVAVALSLDYFYRDDCESDIIVPEYGMKLCYLERQYAPLPYMYGPVGLLLSCNLVFFAITIYAMHKIQQSTKFATSSSSKNQKQKQSVILFAKFFLVMGIPWIFEVISWASGSQPGEVAWYWAILDFINIFQAIAIFIIFVFKRETFNSLEQKYPTFRRFILAVTLRPETAESILKKHPRLKFIINPLTRSNSPPGNFSSQKTMTTDASRSRMSSRSIAEKYDRDDRENIPFEIVEGSPSISPS